MNSEIVANLKIKAPNKEEQVFEIRNGQSLKIGRDEQNEIVIADPGASRVHASFTASNTGLVLADLASTNGTFLNGEKLLTLRDLNSNDVIDIGSTKITAELKSDEIAEQLSSADASRAMTAQLKPVAVSALLITVRNYRKLMQRVPTAELTEMFLAWSEEVHKIIEAEGGEVDKVIDSSILALWTGSGNENELVQQAAAAAVKIQKATAKLVESKLWPQREKQKWECTLVLNSGLGLSGMLGSAEDKGTRGFTLLGDPVNAAFQLEKHASYPDRCFVVAGTSAESIQEIFPLKELAPSEGGSEETRIFVCEEVSEFKEEALETSPEA